MKNFRNIYLLIACTALIPSYGFGQMEITAESPDATANALYGYSIDSDYQWAIVGAPQQDVGEAPSIGSISFFRLSNNKATLISKHTPLELPALSNFGISVALNNRTAVVGSLGDTDGSLFSGAAFVYSYNDTTWSQTDMLKSSDSKIGDRFGYSVDIDGTIIAVGAYQANGKESKSGAVYIFEKSLDGWSESAKLVANDGKSHDFFGHTIKILRSDLVAVGAYNADGTAERSGAVYIFGKNGEGDWEQTAKLFDPNGKSSDLFGYSISSGYSLVTKTATNTSAEYSGTLAIGAPGTNEDGIQTGVVHLYTAPEGTWNLQQTITSEDKQHNMHFGTKVAMNDFGGIFIAATRAASANGVKSGKVFRTSLWGETEQDITLEEITYSAGEDNAFFGTAISSNELFTIISAPYTDRDNLENSGSVHFFYLPYVANEGENELVDNYKLEQNYPNPFNPTTTIRYQVKEAGHVKLTVFNLLGQEVQVLVNEQKANGAYTVNFNASVLSSGFYFYRLEVNDFRSIKKMMLIK